jgi:hypothetical protein
VFKSAPHYVFSLLWWLFLSQRFDLPGSTFQLILVQITLSRKVLIRHSRKRESRMRLKEAWIPAPGLKPAGTSFARRHADSSPQAVPIGQQVARNLTMENAKPWGKRQGIQSPLIISPSNLDNVGFASGVISIYFQFMYNKPGCHIVAEGILCHPLKRSVG